MNEVFINNLDLYLEMNGDIFLQMNVDENTDY